MTTKIMRVQRWQRPLLMGMLLIGGVISAPQVEAEPLPFRQGAVEFPPASTTAVIQTSGPNGAVDNGNWYTSQKAGNRPHRFTINVPCTVPATTTLGLELFDPESYRVDANDLSESIDEIRPRYNNTKHADNTTFALTSPDGRTIAQHTYPSSLQTNNKWVGFATWQRDAYGCGAYRLTAITDDDDENAWRFRVLPADPDGVGGSGDEITVGAFEATFQHSTRGGVSCQTFSFFVPTDARSVRLSNFDMDENESVTYIAPNGARYAGSVSGFTSWNNNGTTIISPRDAQQGGDVLRDPLPGWWSAEVCVDNDQNQYVFEAAGLDYALVPPPTPDLTLHKSDGRELVRPNDPLTYTITYTNVGAGAATNVVLTDTLPLQLAYHGCRPEPCDASAGPNNTTVVRFVLGTVPATTTAQLLVATSVISPLVPGASNTITNTARVTYNDTQGNGYPEVVVTDTTRVPGTPPAPTAVTLGRLRAMLDGDAVRLEWHTTLEINTQGFAVYRSEIGERGSAQRITPTLLPSRALAQGGARYWFQDNGGTAQHTYWLVDVERGGRETWHGPVQARAPRVPRTTVYLPFVVSPGGGSNALAIVP